MPEKSLEGGGWVRLELFDLSHNLYKSSKRKKISQVGERAQETWCQEPIDEMHDATISHHHCRYWWPPGWIFSLFKKISILGVTNDRRLSLVFWPAPEEWNHKENKQMWKMVVTTQKMEQVKSTRGSAPFRATFYYVWTAGKRTKAASW